MSVYKNVSHQFISRMGRNYVDRIVVQGQDLCRDLLGKISLTDMAWLEITGKMPTPQQSEVLDSILVTMVEHGLTPMAIASRLTLYCAPESFQSAVAAGLLGVGSRFAGTMEGAARLLQEAALGPESALPVDVVATKIVQDLLQTKKPIPGIGHPIHKPVDPRTAVLFEVAKRNGYSGRHVELMKAISVAAGKQTGKNLPINATGAVGAVATELGLDWRMCRGLAVIGRCVGLVGHLAEELRTPIGESIYSRADEEAQELARREAGEL